MTAIKSDESNNELIKCRCFCFQDKAHAWLRSLPEGRSLKLEPNKVDLFLEDYYTLF